MAVTARVGARPNGLLAALLATLALAAGPAEPAVASGPYTSLAPLPTARQSLAATFGGDGRLYAIGGTTGFQIANGSGVETDVVEAYTPASNTWAATAPLPKARGSVAAVTGGDGRVYAIGGDTTALPDPVRLASVDVYNPASNSWQSMASMPTARNSLAAIALPDGRILAAGGCGFVVNGHCNILNTVEIFTPAANSWSAGPPMPTARAGLGLAMGKTDGCTQSAART